MKRRILSLAAAAALSILSLTSATLPSTSTCEECAELCSHIPQETAECMAACCGSASPVG